MTLREGSSKSPQGCGACDVSVGINRAISGKETGLVNVISKARSVFCDRLLDIRRVLEREG